MEINKNVFLKWVTLFILMFLSIFAVDCTNSIVAHLIIIIAFAAVAIFMSNLNFSHPYFWFTAFFFLYNCAYMMILVIAPGDQLAKGYDKMSAILTIISLGVTLLCCGSEVQLFDYSEMQDYNRYKFDISLLDNVFYFFSFLLLLSSTILQLQGVTSKAEQWAAHNMFWIIATYCTRFIVFIIALYIFMGDDIEKNSKKIVIASVLIGVFSFMTGERDALLRLLIVLLLALSMVGKIKKRHLFILAPAGVGVMILMNYLKYFFSTGQLNKDFLSMGSILYAFLYSDFADCGSNLQMLLNHPELKGILGYTTIFKDLLSAVLSGGMMNSIFGEQIAWNVSEWYNDYFYRGSSWSRAFTMIGEGYVIGGIIGVCAIFVILGFVIRWMYKKSTNSPYYAAFYVYGASSIIAAFRSDFGSIFQALIRIPVFLLVCLWLVKHLYINRNRR